MRDYFNSTFRFEHNIKEGVKVDEYQKEFQILADFTSKELYEELYRRGIKIPTLQKWDNELFEKETKTYAELDDAETN